MAVSDDQIALIHSALEALNAPTGDRDTLARDVNAGLTSLVTMINQASEGEDVRLPEGGYTKEFGQQLLAQLQNFRQTDGFQSLKDKLSWSFGGTQAAQAMLSVLQSTQGVIIPQAIYDDPQRLITLVEGADSIVAALDAAHDEGLLSAERAEAAPPPPPPEPGEEGTDGAEPPAPPPMTVIGATTIVEEALKGLAPTINGALEGAQAKMQGNELGSLAAQFGLSGLFESFTQVGILDHRIPEITTVDAVFDLRSQASLQALMIFLSDPMVMNLPGENKWYYTPEKGQLILQGLDDLKQRVKQMLGEEEYNRLGLEEQLTRENLAPLIEALDFLATQDPPRISQQLLFSQSVEIDDNVEALFRNILDVPTDQTEIDYLAGFGAHRMTGIAENNPGMLKLADSLTREFTTQFGIHDLMPELRGVDTIGQIDGALTREQRLSQFYKEARAKHAENGHGDTFNQDLMILVGTINTLPFGSASYRQQYLHIMRRAAERAGAISDPDQAAQVFATAVTEGMNTLYQNHGRPDYQQYYKRETPSWRPGLENITVTSGGTEFSATEIARLYDQYHTVAPGNPYRENLKTDVIDMHGPVFFKDDEGNTYIAGIDKESMVFSVERLDVEGFRARYNEWTARYEANEINMDEFKEALDGMRDEFPGFDLLVGIQTPLDAAATMMNSHILSRVQTLSSLVSNYQSDFDTLRGVVETERAREEALIPQNARGVGTDGRTEPVIDRFNPAARGTVFDDPTRTREQIMSDIDQLRDFANFQLNSTPRVIMPHETGIIDMLHRNDAHGPDGQPLKLPVGAYAGSASLRVEKLDLPPRGTGGPLIAFYDGSQRSIRVIETPDYLADPAQRQALMDMASQGADSEEFMRRIRSEYPELFAIVQEYRTAGNGNGIITDNGPIGRNEYNGFKRAMQNVVRNIGADMREFAYQPPGEERQPRTFRDNIELAGRTIVGTPGEVADEIRRKYGGINPGAVGDGLRTLPERTGDAFVSVVNGIGSTVEEAVEVYTGERDYLDRSHHVHTGATVDPRIE